MKPLYPFDPLPVSPVGGAAAVLLPYLAVLQGQLKHFGGAADETHAQAVQHHALAALHHGGGEVMGTHALDETPKAAGDRVLWGRSLHHCLGMEREIDGVEGGREGGVGGE